MAKDIDWGSLDFSYRPTDYSYVSMAAPLYKVSLSDGVRTVDGKSFMEIFCLRLSAPVTVHAECTQEEFDRFFREAEKFLVQ